MTPLVTPDDVKALYDDLADLHSTGGLLWDWAHVVDDWFVKHGYPTILDEEQR